MSVSRHLFYIHGFNSSPKSQKARLLGRYLRDQSSDIDYSVPELSYAPNVAIATLDRAISQSVESGATVGLVGSSMGGFYGTWIAEKYQLPLVLVNPAVRPHHLLKDYLGENTNMYTGEVYEFTEANIEELKRLDIEPVTLPERYWLLTQQGDEVLDYRDGVEKYAACRQTVLPEGSHGFDGFDIYLPEILAFLFK